MFALGGNLRRICGAIIGSAAGLFAFQLLLTLPAIVLLFAILKCVQRLIGRLDGAAQIAWNTSVIFLMLGLLLFATVMGLIVGWGVGARLACGTPLARALAHSRVFSAVFGRIPFVRARMAD